MVSRRVSLAPLAALCLAPGAAPAAAQLTEVSDFGTNPGKLQMLVHVPADLGAAAGLVVVAHGCFQTAAEVAEHSGWLELADRYGFALVFPQTSRVNEPWGGCFRTWEPAHQQRGDGEPLSIRQMIDWMTLQHRIGRHRVFVTGMSSGGLLTNVMLATYPDLFAAGAPQSAYPFKCAESFADVAPCAAGRKRLDPHALGELARSGYPGYRGRRPRVSIWHGSADPLLVPTNLNDQLYQWVDVAGADDRPDSVDFVDGQARYRYDTRAGTPLIETYMVRGLGHAIAVSPDSRERRCGSLSPFFEDAGICAAYWIADWFGLVEGSDSTHAQRRAIGAGATTGRDSRTPHPQSSARADRR
jgi:poly(hydroxyalkanoate) depolymerase family esterase